MTAIEWLMDKLPKSIETQFSKQIEQAKEMEKQQKEDFAKNFSSWLLIFEDIEYDGGLPMNEVLEIFKTKYYE